jgi:hypothetical protein
MKNELERIWMKVVVYSRYYTWHFPEEVEENHKKT